MVDEATEQESNAEVAGLNERVVITRNGLVCIVTSAEETKKLRAADRTEYRKRVQRNIHNKATRYNWL